MVWKSASHARRNPPGRSRPACPRLAGTMAVLCALFTPLGLRAQAILDYLPEDALGFVLIRDVSGASEKCAQLMQVFDVASPAPLELAKFSTGLGEGVDLEGDVLAALLPGSRPTDPPEPMVVLPVADYAKFAASVSGDESGEVCRVTIAGEDVLVARHGPYAMLMNVENRETLEILVGLEPAPVALVEPWAEWLKSNAATLAILPPGLQKLLEMGRQGLAQQRRRLRQDFGEAEFEGMLAQLQQSMAVYQSLLELLGTKVNAAAFGLSLSDSGDLRLGMRFLQPGDRSDPAGAPAGHTPLLAGYPDRPFVLAGGGPTSSREMRELTTAYVLIMKQSPAAYGYQDFDDQAWQDLESSYQVLAQKVRSASMMMLTGEKGDPLFGNFYSTLTLDNASEFLDTFKKSVETWNRLEAQSSSDIQLQWEIHDIKVGGAEACEVLVDVAAAARDPNVPLFNWMLESMFGKEGKLRILLAAADEKTLICGLADEEQMNKALERVKQQEMGLADSAHVQSTLKLLNPEAAWKFYVSPQGCVKWFHRVMDELFGQIVQQPAAQIPEYEAAPPVGVSLYHHGSQIEVDVCWPAPALAALADFIKKCKEL